MAKSTKTQAAETPATPRPAEATAAPKAPEADGTATPPVPSELESLAVRLDAMAAEAAVLGEEATARVIRSAAKSARWSDKMRAARQKRFGSLVARYQAAGLTPEQIIARLTK